MKPCFPVFVAWAFCALPAGNAGGEEVAPSPGVLTHEVIITYRQPQKVELVRHADGTTGIAPEGASIRGGEKAGDPAAKTFVPKKAEPKPATETTTLQTSTSKAADTKTATARTRQLARQPLEVSAPPRPVSHMLDEMDVYELSPAAHLLAEPHRSPTPARRDGNQIARPTKFPQDIQNNPAENFADLTSQPRMAPMLADGQKAPEEWSEEWSEEWPEEWKDIIHEAADLFDLDTRLIAAVIRAESAFNPHAVSPAGAEGAMQIMPATQLDIGLIDPFDPRANIYAGSAYLRQQMERFGDVRLALAAYNAGPANVEKYGGVPPFSETQNFVNRVMAGWRP